MSGDASGWLTHGSSLPCFLSRRPLCFQLCLCRPGHRPGLKSKKPRTLVLISDARHRTKQRKCDTEGGQQESKAASQQAWPSTPGNADGRKGEANVMRMPAWRRAHPADSRGVTCSLESSTHTSPLHRRTPRGRFQRKPRRSSAPCTPVTGPSQASKACGPTRANHGSITNGCGARRPD